MQFGFSSYSFYQYLRDGRMSLLDVIDWIAASDATHMEIATVSLSPEIGNDTSDLPGDAALVAALAARAAETGVTLSNLVVPGDLLGSPDEAAASMARLKRHIDLAAELGIGLFRHDVAKWAHRAKDYAEFEALLPRMVEGSKELAQYAAQASCLSMRARWSRLPRTHRSPRSCTSRTSTSVARALAPGGTTRQAVSTSWAPSSATAISTCPRS